MFVFTLRNVRLKQILSYSATEFINHSTGAFLKRDQRVHSLFYCNLYRVFGNTLLLQVRSSQYSDNGKTWHIYILLPDLKRIIKERKVPLERALEIALDGDIRITCDCPSYLYNGFKYRSTRENYNYGRWRENRMPTRPINIEASNRYLVCKHCVYALEWILDNLSKVAQYFNNYYEAVGFNPDKYISVDEDDNVRETLVENEDGDYEVSEDLPEPSFDETIEPENDENVENDEENEDNEIIDIEEESEDE